jgi:NAD-dependent dihydropyrimidine dehydrogenase PreA subunit
MGPPQCDELLDLIAHLFSPEEAGIAKHIPYYIPRSAKMISRRVKRPLSEVAPLLESMAHKRVILQVKSSRYSLIPIYPGMFEYLLMHGGNTPWHKRYAELHHALLATGYFRGYNTTPIPVIRYIPLNTAIENKNYVVDSDLVSKMIEAHNSFAVMNVCQCRQANAFEGKPCKRAVPEDGCLFFGTFADVVVADGSGRSVTREDMSAIVKERWEKNLVFWAVNIDPTKSNGICTCCDCCCRLFETIEHFGGRASIAEPHFFASVDDNLCKNCGMCVKVCNPHAHIMEGKYHGFLSEKCIGCGLCVGACPENIICLRLNPKYTNTPKSWLGLMVRVMPAGAITLAKAMFRRYASR